jgi:hypothetical protein
LTLKPCLHYIDLWRPLHLDLPVYKYVVRTLAQFAPAQRCVAIVNLLQAGQVLRLLPRQSNLSCFRETIWGTERHHVPTTILLFVSALATPSGVAGSCGSWLDCLNQQESATYIGCQPNSGL